MRDSVFNGRVRTPGEPQPQESVRCVVWWLRRGRNPRPTVLAFFAWIALPLTVFASLAPREEARRLLVEDFAALNRGAKTLAEVGDRARRLAETAETPELSATLLTGAVRLFERAGADAQAAAARKRLEDCRHPFRVFGDAATLKLGEFGEIDFVRCPTGTVDLVLAWPKVRTRAVSISRPYWITKYPLTRRQTAFFSPLDSQKGATPEERTDDYACVNRMMAEGLTEHFARYFARALPTNTVIRLPTLAEWEHAYHAGTRDPSDPFFDLSHVHQGDAVYRAIAYDYDRQAPQRTKRLNAWGIGDWCGQEKVLDTFDPATLVRDAVRGTPDFYLVQSLPDPPCAIDPCFSYAGTNRVSLIRLPFWCRWKAASADFGEDWCPIRLVIAPPVGL